MPSLRTKLVSVLPLLALAACATASEDAADTSGSAVSGKDGGADAVALENTPCGELASNVGYLAPQGTDDLPGVEPVVNGRPTIKHYVQTELVKDGVAPKAFAFKYECTLTSADGKVDPRATSKFDGKACIVEADYGTTKRTALLFSVDRPIYSEGVDNLLYHVPPIDMTQPYTGAMFAGTGGAFSEEVLSSMGDSQQTATFTPSSGLAMKSITTREMVGGEVHEWTATFACKPL